MKASAVPDVTDLVNMQNDQIKFEYILSPAVNGYELYHDDLDLGSLAFIPGYTFFCNDESIDIE